MAVSANAYHTNNLKAALNISTSDTSEDTYLEKLIDRTTDWIEGQTGRKFNDNQQGGFKARKYNGGASTHGTTGVSDEEYIYFSGTTRDEGGDTLFDEQAGVSVFYLPAYPVQANSVLMFALAVNYRPGQHDLGGQTWDTTSYVEWDQYMVDRTNGVLRLLEGSFTPGYLNYRVTMAAGYATGGAAQPYVPDDLEQLCIDVARMAYRDSGNVRSESVAGVSRTFNDFKDHPLIAPTVAKYRRFSLC